MELGYPIMIRCYALREDSEGAGKFRGGLGLVREFEFLTDAAFATMSDRKKFRPWGIGGGHEAKGTDYALITDGERRPLPTKGIGRAKPGDVLSIRTAGGGGYGDPSSRPRELVRRDVEDGKISLERARDLYGWEKQA
jgi:N-methylhydantoinase B